MIGLNDLIARICLFCFVDDAESSTTKHYRHVTLSKGLSKYGPWGYLILGMLLCGGALLVCVLWGKAYDFLLLRLLCTNHIHIQIGHINFVHILAHQKFDTFPFPFAQIGDSIAILGHFVHSINIVQCTCSS